MCKEPYYRESEESYAERVKPHPVLEPGQEICDCGEVAEPEDRHKCVICGYEGCIRCLHEADPGNFCEEWVCSDDCEEDWLQNLENGAESTYVTIKKWVAERREALRLRKAG